MNDLKTAAQQALEALEEYQSKGAPFLACDGAVDNLRAALAQQEEPAQEPAFHGFMSDDGTQVDVCFSPSAPRRDGTYATAYYTAPPHRVAQQAEPAQEPVAYIHRQGNHWEVSERHLDSDEKARGWTEEPLYTAPPHQKQVGWMQTSTGVIRCDWGFDKEGYVPVYAAQEQSE